MYTSWILDDRRVDQLRSHEPTSEESECENEGLLVEGLLTRSWFRRTYISCLPTMTRNEGFVTSYTPTKVTFQEDKPFRVSHPRTLGQVNVQTNRVVSNL